MPVQVTARSAVDDATEAAEKRDPSEFLHCFSCMSFVEDFRHQFCTVCGIKLERTSAAALSKAWIRHDEIPTGWNSDGLQFVEAELPIDMFDWSADHMRDEWASRLPLSSDGALRPREVAPRPPMANRSTWS